MADEQKYPIRRHEFPHGETENMNPGKTESYNPSAFRGFADPPQNGRDYESNAGYRDNYNRLGVADAGNGRHNPQVNHKGKGPKSYRRTDDRILEDINERMCDNPYLDASDIEVSVSNGDVVISGVVENRGAKKLAADIGEGVSGVNNVENRIKVKVRGV